MKELGFLIHHGNMTDEEIRESAIAFAKQNKERIAKELTDSTIYIPETTPISVFMAGSPGAGKTEFSKNLISLLGGNKERGVVRIDPDEIRPRIPGYRGSNSHLFQGAVALIVEKVHDFVLHKSQTFVFDSTLARYEKAVDNIRRSLEKNRPIFIFYVYQKPEIAWKFTQAREKTEGRNIPKSAFIDEFFGAKDVVDRILKEYDKKVVVFLVKKDFEKNSVENIVQLERDGMSIDYYLQDSYTAYSKESLEKLL